MNRLNVLKKQTPLQNKYICTFTNASLLFDPQQDVRHICFYSLPSSRGNKTTFSGLRFTCTCPSTMYTNNNCTGILSFVTRDIALSFLCMHNTMQVISQLITPYVEGIFFMISTNFSVFDVLFFKYNKRVNTVFEK